MYEVSYSGRVIDALRGLVLRNREHSAELLAALREFDRRARIYPQFGQPLRDLVIEPARLWIGVIAPLVFHYVLEEEKRLVMVVRPPIPFPHSGIV
jgi:hypothetical protein